MKDTGRPLAAQALQAACPAAALPRTTTVLSLCLSARRSWRPVRGTAASERGQRHPGTSLVAFPLFDRSPTHYGPSVGLLYRRGPPRVVAIPMIWATSASSVEPTSGIGQSSGELGGRMQSMSHAKACNLLATTWIAEAFPFGPLMAESCRSVVNVRQSVV